MNPRLIIIAASALTLAIALAFWGSMHTVPAAQPLGAMTKPHAAPEKPTVVANKLSDLLSQVEAWKSGEGAAPQRLALIEQLQSLGPGSESKLSIALNQAISGSAKAIIADALARIGTSESVDAIMAALRSTDDPETRKDLVRSFNSLTQGQAIETLASGLATAIHPAVRDGIIATLARTADRNTIEFLTELYHEPETIPGKNETIIAALAAINVPEAATPMKDLLYSTRDLALMQSAVHSLGKIGTAEALQAIADTLQSVGSIQPKLRQEMLGTIEAASNPEGLAWLQAAANGAQRDPDLASAAGIAFASISKSAMGGR